MVMSESALPPDASTQAEDAPESPPQSDGEGAATATEAPPERERRAPARPKPADPKTDRLPPYQVLLHDDDNIDMLYVVESLVEATPLPRRRATRIMLEAHMRGMAQVMVTHQERAELYRDRIRARGLTATIEPMPA
ncbi:MAG: ATP-dependent Clp protease adaptor ClpS [Planctomycetota bacterium]